MAYQSLKPKPISYKSLTLPKMSDIYNSTSSNIPFVDVTRTLPNGGGSYEAPVVNQTTPPIVTPNIPPSVQQPPAQQSSSVDYSKYTNPTTGQVMSPQEYANFMAQRATAGSVPNYAGDSLIKGPQTTEQLMGTATDLNNQRNDIAVGQTDPYNAASKSGIAYSPTEMAAIEKAYAGIYDPVLKDVFAKLDKKAKEEAEASALKNDLAKMAQQHKYDIALKTTPAGGSGVVNGVYVKGANPIVDAYADSVLNKGYKLENVPEDYRGAVAQAIQGQSITPEASPYLASVAGQGRSAVKGLLDIAENNSGIFGRTAAAPVPEFLRSDAYRNYEAQLDFLKGNIIPAALTAMREASKTGGALGQVSDKEGAWLASSLGALSMAQSPEAAIEQLRLIDESLARWEDAVKQYGGTSSSSGVLKSPDGTQEVSVADLTPAELEEAKALGWK